MNKTFGEPGVWLTRDKTAIIIEEMSDRHLSATVDMLHRKAAKLQKWKLEELEAEQAAIYSYTPGGEGAQLAQESASREVDNNLDYWNSINPHFIALWASHGKYAELVQELSKRLQKKWKEYQEAKRK